MCVTIRVCLNKFLNFFSVFLATLTPGYFVPGPRAVKPARSFATRRAKKLQGLSNQYPISLKNQLHSTWPPHPHSLAGRPRMHSARGPNHWQLSEHARGGPLPPCCARTVVRAVPPLASSLLQPSLLVNFLPFLSLREKSDNLSSSLSLT